MPTESSASTKDLLASSLQFAMCVSGELHLTLLPIEAISQPNLLSNTQMVDKVYTTEQHPSYLILDRGTDPELRFGRGVLILPRRLSQGEATGVACTTLDASDPSQTVGRDRSCSNGRGSIP